LYLDDAGSRGRRFQCGSDDFQRSHESAPTARAPSEIPTAWGAASSTPNVSVVTMAGLCLEHAFALASASCHRLSSYPKPGIEAEQQVQDVDGEVSESSVLRMKIGDSGSGHAYGDRSEPSYEIPAH
jgi:hypothetical protein